MRIIPKSPFSTDAASVLYSKWQKSLATAEKARGTGGPWRGTAVKAGVASDPYLATGYDQKRPTLLDPRYPKKGETRRRRAFADVHGKPMR